MRGELGGGGQKTRNDTETVQGGNSQIMLPLPVYVGASFYVSLRKGNFLGVEVEVGVPEILERPSAPNLDFC